MANESFDIEKALAMAAGHDMGKFYDLQISEDDKQLLHDALENIFQGSSVILWVHGGTLSDAWKKTLDSMRDEFFATSRRDVLTVFLQHAVFEHRNKWMEKIRTNDNCNQIFALLGASKTDEDKMLKQAMLQKQQGYDVIKKIIEKYDSGFVPKPVSKDKPILNLAREHEHDEYVRERTK